MVVKVEQTEHWLELIDWLERHDGRVQIKLDVFAEQIGWVTRTLSRYITRMEQLGVVRVIRTTRNSDWGTGRVPNTYVLQMTADEWVERGPEIRKRWLREQRAKRRAARNRASPDQVPVTIPAIRPRSREARALEEATAADVAERLDAAEAAEEALIAEGEEEDLDVDAWLAGS